MEKNQLTMYKKYHCERCDFSCNCLSIWTKHTETELHKTGKRKIRKDKIKGIYKCEKCKYTTKVKSNYKMHILNQHSNGEEKKKEFKYYCDVCNFGTFGEKYYNIHLNTKKHKKMSA